MAIGLNPGMMFRGFGDPRATPPYAPVDVPQAPEMAPGAGMGAVPAAKSGFFGEGGLGRGIAGSIGDFLLQNSGMRPIYAPAMQQRQARQQQLQDRAAERRAASEEWVQRQIWEREHPAPATPHYFETNDGSQGVIGPDGKPQIIYKDPTPKTTWQAVDNGDGTKQLIPFVNGQPVGAGGGVAPAAPMNNGLPEGFTVRKRGGGATQATSPFPR